MYITKSTNMNDRVNSVLNIAKHHLFYDLKHMWSALTSTCWSLRILFKELNICYSGLQYV